MRQCEIERVMFDKRAKAPIRTGEKLVTFLDVSTEMKGAILELKKIMGYWVIDQIHEQDIEAHDIKRNWHVGGL